MIIISKFLFLERDLIQIHSIPARLNWSFSAVRLSNFSCATHKITHICVCRNITPEYITCLHYVLILPKEQKKRICALFVFKLPFLMNMHWDCFVIFILQLSCSLFFFLCLFIYFTLTLSLTRSSHMRKNSLIGWFVRSFLDCNSLPT